MAYVAPTNVSTGDVLTATRYNQEVVENTTVLRSVLANVKSTTKESSFTSASTHNTFQDVTGLSVTITPSSSSSLVLVMTTISVSDGATAHLMFKLLRGSTDIAFPTTSAGTFPSGAAWTSPGSDKVGTLTIMHLDNPATTAATTYKVQGRSSANLVWYVNIRGDAATRQVSSITAMEVPV